MVFIGMLIKCIRRTENTTELWAWVRYSSLRKKLRSVIGVGASSLQGGRISRGLLPTGASIQIRNVWHRNANIASEGGKFNLYLVDF